MTLHTGFGVKGSTQDASDYRLGEAGLVMRTASGVPRYGVFPPGVTGTGRADMSIDVSPFVAAVGRGSAYGVLKVANDGTLVSPPLDAAPSSNSRKDVVYVIQHDSVDAADADNLPVLGIAKGTAAAIPTVPAVPSGAAPLLVVTLPALVGSTNAGGVTITQAGPSVVASGGILPVLSGVRPSDPGVGQYIDDPDLGLLRRGPSGWERYRIGDVPVIPTSVLGAGTSLNADGSISFSGATSVAVINAFDASAEKFMIDVFLDTKTASTDTLFQFLNAGGGSVTSGYVGETILAASGSINAVAQNPNGWYFDKGQTSPMSTLMTIFRPFQAGPKTAHTDSSSGTGLSVKGLGGHAFSGSSSFSSFQLSVVSGTISGKMWITKVVR